MSYFKSSLSVLLMFVLMPVIAMAETTLDENCTINILNRTVQVEQDGSWTMPNVPSFMRRVKARATCLVDNKTISGESGYFTVSVNDVKRVGVIQFKALNQFPHL